MVSWKLPALKVVKEHPGGAVPRTHSTKLDDLSSGRRALSSYNGAHPVAVSITNKSPMSLGKGSLKFTNSSKGSLPAMTN